MSQCLCGVCMCSVPLPPWRLAQPPDAEYFKGLLLKVTAFMWCLYI